MPSQVVIPFNKSDYIILLANWVQLSYMNTNIQGSEKGGGNNSS